MSKLAHSHQPSMDRIALVEALANYEDVSPVTCQRCDATIDDIGASECCDDPGCWLQSVLRDAEFRRRHP